MNQREALLEALYDLKHDLGKYIRLPVTLLPKDAAREDLVHQTRKAVFETRQGPDGVLSAEEVFKRFAAEWDAVARAFNGYGTVREALARAVLWGERVADPTARWERDDLVRDLSRVGAAIQAWIQEVSGGD